ncbi:2-amino-4-hydroxy-6- hydroxymethyldihydropteridine pyrophosphokinase [Prochlorococcus marinus str. MIT 9107]|uniref:2-amino-4-hydroxy-6-hydroxymethyldihydropteridine diphosphokinase n=1 Tax=Prochlorococcus marinus str. MIT 9116 TaxID=167544 RepID=A0A0A1ZJU2_PROMR|nr:2-amino-4-hydroxy-6- hydroxymethyldihydropteridine pyrophosphokinase [Prochlorococcus marinus str. MIT 9107]KGF89877.1 2-amino-4-hydroxy-6- hydroxymethyldihydropteridine pyrophosphokinase [Prochlorococcus marinus str. MIT 9116]KGF95207.1 2-amino-4-hydroxy-6- hydroxymethyldihydropteridine pyrophosphokinase [Prochlorococcus marinus str. MIT 9123]
MFFVVELSNLNIKNGLCISLGANIDSKFGSPLESLLVCKPKVEEIVKEWGYQSITQKEQKRKSNPNFLWSSIYETSPYGVEDKQPNYLNTLVLIKSNYFPKPSKINAKLLLKKLKKLEIIFGRIKTPKGKKWLSRCLDLDILWWEDFHTFDKQLILPHPRFMNRNFVITPLSEILSRSQKIKKIDEPRWSISQ